ncbi:D-alanyl-D-alanine carboxypeptidase/D-alanyl-D-alanine-endopeptidase [Algoriphagus aquatilis]|uniref:D-alanyl-D-alanine carboxypeptidase/D-alanyl-D-alanine-endopeptidase n=1 Tax=Algoriphagus aquatilis TaxID=490186 RepID=A0ABW0BTG4_9BACT
MIKRGFFLFLILLVQQQLSAQIKQENYLALEKALGPESFFNGHLTGFMLYDLDSQHVEFEKNSQIRILPASTTKLFTLFASLVILQDSTQTLRYVSAGDTLKIWGSGDPTWKYKEFAQPDFQKVLGNHSVIQYSDANQVSPALGYGWQWDDYYYDYSAERSSLPIYGNLVQIQKNGAKLELLPSFFQNQIVPTSKRVKELERDFHSNRFYYNPSIYVGRERFIPFLSSPEILVQLAEAETGKRWIYKPEPLPSDHLVWRASALTPILKEMMQESDNFLAEQLLFMISDRLFQTLDTERAIEYMVKTYLNDLPDQPKWVDGSGLSRHNLFTPRSMVTLFEKLYRLLPEAELNEYLAIGGKTGTLKNSFQAAEPYIFAKTGSMSNNYSLVGLVKTKSGKNYAFAFMNTNFPYPASTVRKEVEKVMVIVRDGF